MRKTLGLAVMVVLLASSVSFAADTASNEISIDLVNPVLLNVAAIFGGHPVIPINVCYERVLDDRFVLSFNPFLTYWTGSHDQLEFDFWAELNWHPWGGGLNGFFAGPFVGMKFEGGSDLTSSYAAGIGIALGYQFLFGNGWGLSLEAGFAPLLAYRIPPASTLEVPNWAFDYAVRGGAFIGYRF